MPGKYPWLGGTCQQEETHLGPPLGLVQSSSRGPVSGDSNLFTLRFSFGKQRFRVYLSTELSTVEP